MEFLGLSFGLVGADILNLGGVFVAVVLMEVDDLELEVGVVAKLVWSYLKGRLYFLWCLVECRWKKKCLMLVVKVHLVW